MVWREVGGLHSDRILLDRVDFYEIESCRSRGVERRLVACWLPWDSNCSGAVPMVFSFGPIPCTRYIADW